MEVSQILVLLFALAYILPLCKAHQRKHNAFWPITIVNLIFGWTVIGWIICLIWAYGPNTKYNFPNDGKVIAK